MPQPGQKTKPRDGLAIVLTNGPGGLTIGFLLLEGFPFVVQFFPFGDPDFQLDQAVFQINFGRNQGKTFFIDQTNQFANLGAMQQQLAHPGRINGVFPVALFVGADVHIVDEDLAIFDSAVGFLEIDLAKANRLDLGSGQHQAGFIDIFDEVVVPGFFVVGNNFNGHRPARLAGFLPLSEFQ